MIATVLLDKGLLPDWVIRLGIRRLLRARLRREDAGSPEGNRARLERHVAAMEAGPVAAEVGAANEQHYEVPAAFFERVLGRHLKYSCGLWADGVDTLDEAEEAMLATTATRAAIEDGMEVLDLGCGWGSMSLWIARTRPRCRVTAVSNSHAQRLFIESRCRAEGLDNVQVITHDANTFTTDKRFDRIVSIEMFEHMRNWRELLRRVAGWLRPDGLAFVHVFAHRRFAYAFEPQGAANWMGRHFFTGGQMPSADLLPRFGDHLRVVRQWEVPGTHYARTARAWLDNLDAHRMELAPILASTGGAPNGHVALRRWRAFFMACEELWAFDAGREWFVCHYLLRHRDAVLEP